MRGLSNQLTEIIQILFKSHDIEYVREIINKENFYLYEGRIKASEPQLEPKRVTVKILQSDNDEVKDFFDQEASIYTHLNHKNIVRIEFSEKIRIKKGTAKRYIVTEYLDGKNLEQILTYLSFHGHSLELTTSLHIIKEVLEGLSLVKGFLLIIFWPYK